MKQGLARFLSLSVDKPARTVRLIFSAAGLADVKSQSFAVTLQATNLKLVSSAIAQQTIASPLPALEVNPQAVCV